MRRTFKIVRWLLVLVLVAAVVVVSGGYVLLRRSLPQVDGVVTVAGVSAPVEIIRDVDGIPHIMGQTRGDVFFGLGYVHAQDRLWQMEFQRRIGQGRLSEMLGATTVLTDRFLRTLGVYRSAQNAWETLSPSARGVVEAYTAGINAFVGAHSGSRLPPEFTLVGMKPEPWTGPDVLVWAKMMAYDLGDNWVHELARVDIAGAVGVERMQALMPGNPEDEPSIMTAASDGGNHEGLLALDAEVRALMGVTGFGGEDLGSNNWVVDGTKTTTGKPLLADDPHLGSRVPSIWYLAHLSAPDYEVIGASIPGLPTVIIGRNRAIAWGVTNVGGDVQDLYRERLDATGRLYEVDGVMQPMQTISDTIKVKGAADVPLLIRVTHHGPLISDALNVNDAAHFKETPIPAKPPLAFRWTALDPADTTFQAFMGITEAQNWEQFREALRFYVAPAQNFVYADIEGNIGYYAPGRFPIRTKGDGTVPAEGYSGAEEWTGYVPFEQLPQAYNPPEHFIATANNRPVPPNYPYLLGKTWALPYRYQRIVQMIEAKEKLSPEDFARMQGDTVSLHARELLPRLLPLVTPKGEDERRALALLDEWDGDTRSDSAAAAIFAAWYARLPHAIAGDELGKKLIDWYEDSFTFARPFVFNVLSSSQNAWCDNTATNALESCASVVQTAFTEALADLRAGQGGSPESWRWGSVHTVKFPHQPFDNVPMLSRFFSRSIPNGGDHSTVNVGPFDLDGTFEQHHIPGYRQIIDLSRPDGGQFIHSVGQSGHILSAQYDAYLVDWQAVRYRPMRFEREAIMQATAATLRLEPANP